MGLGLTPQPSETAGLSGIIRRSRKELGCSGEGPDSEGADGTDPPSAEASPTVGGESTDNSSEEGAPRQVSTDSAGDGRNDDSTPLVSETEDGDEPRQGIPRFACVSAEVGHTCGVRMNGFVSCWGGNEDGLAMPPAGGVRLRQRGDGPYLRG